MENEIIQRLRLFIKQNRLTNKAFCELIEVPEGTLKTMFNRDTNPSLEFLIKVSKAYPNLSLKWLLEGEGNSRTVNKDEKINDSPNQDELIDSISTNSTSIGGSSTNVGNNFGNIAGENIKKFRKDHNLTQSELAKITGTSVRAVQSWEQDQRNISQSAIKLMEIYAKEDISHLIKDLSDHQELNSSILANNGYKNIPGITAEQFFPVVGYSMLPQIKPGDIIGVRTIENLDNIDPERIYLIVNQNGAMLKRLRIDTDSDKVLWCFSPTHEEFKILKKDIRKLYLVVFHGEYL